MKKIILLCTILLISISLSACSKQKKVTFDTDGGTYIEPVEVKKGCTITKPNDPTKEDAFFSGWYLDGKEFDFNTPITENITLVAKWRTVSDQDKFLASKYLSDYSKTSYYSDYVTRLSKVFARYNITDNDINTSLKTKEEIMNDLIANNKMQDMVSFFLEYYDIKLEIEARTNIKTNLLDQKTDQYVTQLYNSLKKENLYISDFAYYKQDSNFSSFILPVVYFTLMQKANYVDIKEWLVYNINNGTLYHFDIKEKNHQITFINKITNKEYIYTYEELENIINNFNSCSDITLKKQAVILYRNCYKAYFNNILYQSIYEDLLKNDHLIASTIQNYATVISESITDIYNTINIIRGFNDKLSNLMDSFNEYDTQKELSQAIKEAINFKNQVLIELKHVLPDLEALLYFEEVYKELSLDKVLMINNLYMIPEFNIDNIISYYKEMINLIEDTVKVLETITEKNYNIDIVASCIINNDYQNSAFVNEINKLSNSFTEILKKNETFEFNYEKIFDISKTIMSLDRVNLDNLFNILYKDSLNEDTFQTLNEEITKYQVDYTNEEINTMYKFMGKYLYNTNKITKEDIDSFVKILNKNVQFLPKEIINILEDAIIDTFAVSYGEDKIELIKQTFNLLLQDYDSILLYMQIINYNQLYSYFAEESIYKGMSYTQRQFNIAKDQITYMYELMTKENIVKLQNIFTTIYNTLDFVDINFEISSNLEKNINIAYNMLTTKTSLTNDEKAFINQLLDLFNGYYVY